ncbi:ficolin-2-like [Haemaphysalis longicornis]
MDTDGGGWTVIQRRGQFGNNAYYFYRNWTEYAAGFGDPNKEYWIGNRALHALTSEANDTALRIVLTNGTGESVSLDYGSFHVGSEQQHFKLNIGKYFGPAGWDSMSTSQDCSFSTHDRDNDRGSASCAVKYHGAWWYNDCFYANLNGLNLNGYHDSFADGIEWILRGSTGFFAHYSYPEVLMMIRIN